MNIWLTMLGMMLVTYLPRLLPLLSFRGNTHPLVDRALRYVPPAIFAALIVPELLVPDRQLQAGPALWAGLLGLLVAWRTRSMALTIVLGMGAFSLLRLLGV